MKLVARLVMVAAVPALAVSLLFSPIADNVSADYQPALGWTKYTGDLDLGGELLVTDAWVIKDSDTYRMWYTRIRLDDSFANIAGSITGLDGPAIAEAFINMQLDTLLNLLGGLSASDVMDFLDSATTVIGYATSTNGINWTIENNEVLGGAGSLHNGVGAPCVVKDGTTYKMWYTRFEVDWNQTDLSNILVGLGGTPAQQQTAIEDFLSQTRSVIGYATSDDLITWTVQNNQVFPAADGNILGSVGAPSVIKEGDTDYKMWYTGINTDLTLADIADVLTDTGSFDLDAIIGLLDGSASVIGYATSTDGEDWTDSGEVLSLSGSGPLWESVGDPCVVKANGTYEMWYTRGTTDLTTQGMSDLLDAIKALNLSGLWAILDSTGIADFLTAYLARDLTTVNGLISNTSSVIAYATSPDGAVWTVQDESDLTGNSANLWSSVGAPCVIGDGSNYTMWFTEGIGTLDFQSLFDLIYGSDCTIGQATYPPSGGGFPGGGALPPPPGTTPLAGLLDVDGYFLIDVVATSEDELAWVTIPEGTKGLDNYDYPLNQITIVPMEDPPDPPADHSVIGVTYDFGPDGATFDPPITLTITYDPALIPEGVAEEDLTIAVWDDDTDTWVELPSVVDTENNTISVQIDGFTGFAILAATAPASFSLLFLSITPGEVDINQTVEVTVTVINTGDLSGTYQIELLVNDQVEAVQAVTLNSSERTTVSFKLRKSVPGSYTVSIAGLTGSFTVKEAEVTEPDEPEPEPEADIIVSGIWVTPPAPKVGEAVTISALFINRGEGEGSYDVILYIDGNIAESRTVTLTGNSEQTVTFTTIPETTGIHTVEVDDLSAIFAVLKGVEEKEEPAVLNWWLIGGILGGCAVITAISVVFLMRRRFA